MKSLPNGLVLVLIFTGVIVTGCATQKTEQVPPDVQEKCDAPVWNVGDTWRYIFDNKNEGEIKVLGVEDFKKTKIYIVGDVYSSSRRGYDVKTLQYIVDITPDGRKMVPMTDWTLSFDFPLYVGKKWSKMVSGEDAGNNPRNYLYTYKVISFENITVQAGAFRAFKIEFTQVDYVTSSEVKIYIWYSPEVKNWVKVQFGSAHGRVKITGQDYELKSFKVKDKRTIQPEEKSLTGKVEPTTKPKASSPEK